MARGIPRLLVWILAMTALPAAVARAQSYGAGEQVLAIGSPAFRPVNGTSPSPLYSGNAYLYGSGNYLAPIELPDGAQITMMCLYADDPDADSLVIAELDAAKMPAGGQSPGLVPVPNSQVTANFDIGFGTVCTGPLSYTFHTTADLDGQGVENLFHFVNVSVAGVDGLGGVRVFWHRQVSPLPAASSFDDVPLGTTYSQFIEALKASGVTAGCQADPPLYCPDRPITRAEMAVYLSLALGLHWVE
jgi:hypothetical protein